MDKTLYIGDKKIRSTEPMESDRDSVKVTFVDNSVVELKRKLYDLIKKEEKGNGTVTDCIKAYIAREFLLNMADYGLEVMDIEGVATAIGNLTHNLREVKIG